MFRFGDDVSQEENEQEILYESTDGHGIMKFERLKGTAQNVTRKRCQIHVCETI